MNESFEDPLLEQAIEWVITNQKASISGIQRNFRIGYNRASQFVDFMESIGVVSSQGFDGNRTILCPVLEDAHALLR